MTRTVFSACVAAGLACGAIGAAMWASEAAANEPPVMDGKTVRDTVAGRRIYLSVPFGGELPLYYRKDGRVDGSGEAAGLGRFLKPSDSGRWWVDGNRLCQQWTSWYDGRTFCFRLAPAGPNRVAWFRDDGEKGVARVGD